MNSSSDEMLIVFALAARCVGDESGPPPPCDFEVEDDVGCRRAAAAGQRMTRREVHAIAAAVDRRLQQLGELDEQRHARSASAPRRPALMRGFSAATSSRAVSRTASGSPTGGAGIVSRGMRGGVASSGRSCMS